MGILYRGFDRYVVQVHHYYCLPNILGATTDFCSFTLWIGTASEYTDSSDAGERGAGTPPTSILAGIISYSCFQVFYASELIWAASIVIIKLSILLLYIRLFGRLRYIRLWAYWLSIFSVCWGIMVILGCSFQCRPLRFIWDKSINGTCINVGLFFILGSAPNVLTDFLVLALPLPAVLALQTSRGQKISLVGIFMLGSM